MKASSIRSVCVYCGSGLGNDPVFEKAAEALGAALAQNGLRLVYGGGTHGLMGTVARATLKHGGQVTGIIPQFLETREGVLQGMQETHVVPDMHTRKQMMFERADAFVALPGGLGTLEELVEQMTWAQLGRHRKPILLLSIADFWKPLLVLIAHMRQFAFVRPGLEVHYMVAEKVEDVVPMLQNAARHTPLR